MPRRVHIAPQIRFHSTSGKFYVTLVTNKRTPLGRLPKGRTWKKGDPVPLDVQRAYARAIANWQPDAGEQSPVETVSAPTASLAPVVSVEDPYPLTCEELIATYWVYFLGYYRKNGKPTAEIHRVKAALRMVRREAARKRAADFRLVDLERVRTRYIDHRYGTNNEKRYTRPIINAYVGIIGRMFRWAASRGHVPAAKWYELRALEPLKKGRFDVPEGGEKQPVPVADVLWTLPHLETNAANLIRFLGLMGCRDETATIARAGDFIIDARLGRIYRPEWHKNEHHDVSGDVPVSDSAWRFIRPLVKAAPTPESYLFLNPKATKLGRYSTGTLIDAVAKAVKAAKVPHWTPGQLRHAKLTQLRHTEGLEAAQLQAAHTSARMTEHYAKLQPDPIDIDQAMLRWKPGCDVKALITVLTPKKASRRGQGQKKKAA